MVYGPVIMEFTCLRRDDHARIPIAFRGSPAHSPNVVGASVGYRSRAGDADPATRTVPVPYPQAGAGSGVNTTRTRSLSRGGPP